MPLRRCRALISPHSFMQAALAHSDYVRPECDCQSISVSQYLPVVIRVDGVINKGKLQECKQPPPSASNHLSSMLPIRRMAAVLLWNECRFKLVWNQKSLVLFH